MNITEQVTENSTNKDHTESELCLSCCMRAVQKVSDIFFSAETNEAREVCCGREVEGTFMHIHGFFPTSSQPQSCAASV
jgi:hypothetical protein